MLVLLGEEREGGPLLQEVPDRLRVPRLGEAVGAEVHEEDVDEHQVDDGAKVGPQVDGARHAQDGPPEVGEDEGGQRARQQEQLWVVPPPLHQHRDLGHYERRSHQEGRAQEAEFHRERHLSIETELGRRARTHSQFYFVAFSFPILSLYINLTCMYRVAQQNLTPQNGGSPKNKTKI